MISPNDFASLLALTAIGALVFGSRAQGKADRDMQAVLDKLAELGPRPIETLTPAEARQQPTPADAVKTYLQAKGKPATPEPVANVENRTIDGPGGDIHAGRGRTVPPYGLLSWGRFHNR